MRRKKNVFFPRRRRSLLFPLRVLAMLIVFGLPVLGGCRVPELPLFGGGDPLPEQPPAPQKVVPALPPRFMKAGGQDLKPEGLRGLLKGYDYIIVDGDPGNSAHRALQAELLEKADDALAEAEAQGMRHAALPVRRPVLCLESLSLDHNAILAARDHSASLFDPIPASPASRNPSSPSTDAEWDAQWQAALGVYQELLRAAHRQTRGKQAQAQVEGQTHADDGVIEAGHLALRGLSLPRRVARHAWEGTASLAALPREDRLLLPPLVLPMPEKRNSFSGKGGAANDGNSQAQAEAPIPPAHGSSETAVLREPEPEDSVRFINLNNSAMAWNARRIAHEDVKGPLFIVLGKARFDQGDGLAEAIAYFDREARVIQFIMVDARAENIETDHGENGYVLLPKGQLPPIGKLGPAEADTVFVLVQQVDKRE